MQYNSAQAPSTTAKQQVAEELKQTLGQSKDVLVRATSVFPLTLFPDTISVDRTKLTITRRAFFKVAEVISMPLDDILTVEATVGPYFGTITIDTRYFTAEKPYTLRHFTRDDALRVKRIAQGYIIAHQKEIDCTAMPTKELADMLDKLGRVGEAEKV